MSCGIYFGAPYRHIQPDHLAIEHLVGDDLLHRLGVVGGCAQANSIGVPKMPGAMVMLRMPLRARSRAIGKVMPTTPPLLAA